MGTCYIWQMIHSVDRSGIGWHRFPVFLGLAYLGVRRSLHNKYNLLNVRRTREVALLDTKDVAFRTANITFNDLVNVDAGSEGSFFGRNILPVDQRENVCDNV